MTKLEELKAAYEAATPGEWNNTEQSNGLNSVYGNCQFDSMADADLIAFDLRNGDDAEFIALAHNLMPTLLEVVELLKDAREAYMAFACDESLDLEDFVASMQGILAGDVCSDILEKLK